MNVGPSPARARAAASRSDLVDGEDVVAVDAHARDAVGPPLDRDGRVAVWRATGTLIDQWLFWQRMTPGVLYTPAKFIAVWKSGWLVAPSPRKPTAIDVGSSRIFIAHAAPTACGICGPMHDDHETWFTARPEWWLGICRPFSTSPELPKTCAMKLVSGKPRTSITLCSRSAGKTQSSGSMASAVAIGTASCPVHAP